jgi:hypothetical protein
MAVLRSYFSREISAAHTQDQRKLEAITDGLETLVSDHKMLNGAVGTLSEAMAEMRMTVCSKTSANRADTSGDNDQLAALAKEVHKMVADMMEPAVLPGFMAAIKREIQQLITSEIISHTQWDKANPSRGPDLCSSRSETMEPNPSTCESAQPLRSHATNIMERGTAHSQDSGLSYLPRARDLLRHSQVEWLTKQNIFGLLGFRFTTLTKPMGSHNNPRGVETSTKISVVFHPATWLIRLGLNSGLEAVMTQAKQGWKFALEPIRAVKDDAVIFKFCVDNNLEAVQELLSRGDASVLDTRSDGMRPLHVSWIIPYLHKSRSIAKV